MFPIVTVPDGAAELSEQMGTKFKFWYLDERGQRTLFKEGRPGTGENWAEKLASEFAQLLGIPHADYELAQWMGMPSRKRISPMTYSGLLIRSTL